MGHVNIASLLAAIFAAICNFFTLYPMPTEFKVIDSVVHWLKNDGAQQLQQLEEPLEMMDWDAGISED